MSQDFQLAWPCPHLTVEEHVFLDSDRRTLQLRQPVGGAGTVRLLVNNNERLFIPQSGLFTAAQLLSTPSGPFDLFPGEDELTVDTPDGSATVSFGVTTTTRLTTSQVVKVLRSNQLGVALAENLNGHLLLSDLSTVGPDSYVRVRGSAATALGFGDSSKGDSRQRGARGRQLFPPWTLISRLDIADETNRIPQFTSRVRTNPMLKATYTVPKRRCLRCGGGIIENDYRFDTAGQGLLIENENLLYQAALKILLTDRGSNPYHDWYGSTIRSRIGAKAIGGVAAAISEDVRRTLVRMQSVQKEQAQYQQVTAKERLYAILQVQTSPHIQDPTTFLVDVVVQNASAEPISLSIIFSVPEVVALLGSNGLFLGTEAVGLERELSTKLLAGRTILPVDGG